MYQIENIPDEDLLYYRAHKTYIRGGKLLPGVFSEKGDGDEKGMSTDWSKYSSSQESRSRARNPEDNGILQAAVGKIRNIGLQVDHAPLDDNRAHTNVKGLSADLTDCRRKLMNVFHWAIEINL